MHFGKYGLVASVAALMTACAGGEDAGSGATAVSNHPAQASPEVSAKAPADKSGTLLKAPVGVGTLKHYAIDALPYAPLVGEKAKCDVHVVKLHYRTPGVHGESADASAAMLVPAGANPACSQPRPLLAYGRGTEVSRTRTLANPADWETQQLAAFFAAQGYVVVATDFLGYAESNYSYHPYLQSATEASSIVDSIRAARTYAQTNKIAMTDQVLLYGYSSGGHATLSAQKAIETGAATGEKISIAAASHGAAPISLETLLMYQGYSPAGTPMTRPLLYGQVLGPFFITAADKTYKNVYSTARAVFNPSIAPGIGNLLPSKQYDFVGLMAGGPLPKDLAADYRPALYTSQFLQELGTNPASPIRVAALKNDLAGNWDWRPRSKTLLCAGDNDYVVPPALAQTPAVSIWGRMPAAVPDNLSQTDSKAVEESASWYAQNVWTAPVTRQADYPDFGTFYVLGYHDIFLAPACLKQAKDFFDNKRPQ